MAVFRSDQAQVTFASEAGQGGDFERYTAGSPTDLGSTGGYLTVAANPGDRIIKVNATTGLEVGMMITIGLITGLHTSETRRVEYIDGNTNVHLDRPLAFPHATTGNNSNGKLYRIDDALKTSEAGRKYITMIPGVYETVDVPDMTTQIEPRYFLGTQSKRNYFQAYKGQQSFAGGMSNMVLLNGFPLRFPIGKVVTVPLGGSTPSIAGAISGNDLTPGTALVKGDIIVAGDHTATLDEGDYVVMSYGTNPTRDSYNSEIRRIASIGAAGFEVNYPFMIAHGTNVFRKLNASQTNLHFKHHIVETVDLDTISMHEHMRDSGESSANDFDRRYVGGMVGSMTLNAEEGGLLLCSWDSIPFLDMVHNQKKMTGVAGPYSSSGLSGASVNDLPRFATMHTISATDVNKLPGTAGGATGNIDDETQQLSIVDGVPSSGNNAPYYFSQGSISISGQEFARIRSFTLSVSNNEEPRYYISPRHGQHRGPSEIREQQREYSLSATVVLPDTANAMTDDAVDTATALFKQLILEGDYGSISTPNFKGFTVTLKFTRDTYDDIIIDMPGIPVVGTSPLSTVGTPTSPTRDGNEQGVIIRGAPHVIDGSNPLQVDLDMLVRSLNIQIRDNIAIYP